MHGYGIQRIREIIVRRNYLERMLALNSREALVRRAERAVDGSGELVGMLWKPMGLLCTTGRWKYP